MLGGIFSQRDYDYNSYTDYDEFYSWVMFTQSKYHNDLLLTTDMVGHVSTVIQVSFPSYLSIGGSLMIVLQY